jgi:hypothetical protein
LWATYLAPYSAQRQVRDEALELVVAVCPGPASKADANARLIAAAPEMLAALRSVLDAARVAHLDGEWLDSARAAIAKATGGDL